jgi:hypothetical protein
MKIFRIAAALCVMSACAATPSFGAARTYATASFRVTAPAGYSYLEKAVPSTLSSRLYMKGQLESVSGKASDKAPGDEAEAGNLRKSLKADYLIWGKVTVVEEECDLDVRVLGGEGKQWRKTAKCPVGGLIGVVQGIADSMGEEVFGRPAARMAGGGQAASGGINRDIVINRSGQQQTFLNPQFRYQGGSAGDASRLRTQALPFVMVDFLVGNFSGRGKNEVAVLGDHKLHIFSWEQGRLKPLAETTVSMSSRNFTLRSMDLNGDGLPDLVISAFIPDSASDPGGNEPSSYVYSFAGGRLQRIADRSRYFLSVVRMPPTFMPMLVGQEWDPMKVFAAGVREAHKSGNKYVLGGRLNLPKDASAFNFAWLPGGKSGEGDRLVVLAGDERLKVFGPKGDELHKSLERYSGSSVGIEQVKSMPGLGRDNVQIPDKYFAPMRMIPLDLRRTGEYVLLVNKPISTAAQFFDRYRFFPEGEIHALFWDGVGLGLQWKTRRIKGSVVALDVADIMNNGAQCLIVGINSHPGALGISRRQSFLLIYPMDASRMDPNTPWDMSDFEGGS